MHDSRKSTCIAHLVSHRLPLHSADGVEDDQGKSADDVAKFMSWVDQTKKLRVLANADTPADAREARKNGAEGIGLTRTEHMFFAEDRINVVRKMILSTDPEKRQKAMNELMVFQRGDFEGILEAMDGLPVTVRLLDPPLHEFLPRLHADEGGQVVDDDFAASMGMTKEEVVASVKNMQEVKLQYCAFCCHCLLMVVVSIYHLWAQL